MPTRRRGRLAIAIHATVSGIVAASTTLLWAATGGGSFWPKWVWLGLAIPMGLHGALHGALRVRRRRARRIAVQAAVSGVVSGTLIVIWAFAGGGMFWPLIPITVLGGALGLHAALAGLLPKPQQELVERVDELTRTRRGALDVQASELRRIERDLHDGAQARLVALIVAATAAFVVGVSIERGDEAAHHDAAREAPPPSDEHQEAGGEGEEHAEGESAEAVTSAEEPHAELRPLGIDVEAWPFVAAAALASLALAAGAWLHPRHTALLTLVALAMLAFAALDVREVFHQADIDESGLAVLAGAVAALHLAAAAVAAAMASRSRGSVAAPTGSAGTMAA